MSRSTRYNANNAALRARATQTSAGTATTTALTTSSPAVAGGEYVMLSVWQIHPAPWQPRRVFEHLEELAATIEGNAETEGVGVLEPVLVRRREDGSFELIDGERRLRAGRLIAERLASRDFLLPARVFTVSERVARLMGQTANLERDEPKPYEVALGYQRIREALRAEVGDEATSARAIAGLGRHGKTQVADYLFIADALCPHVLDAAGFVSEQGETDFALLTRLTKKELHRAAKLKHASVEACAAALKMRVERLLGIAPARAEVAVAPPVTPEERRAQFATETPVHLKVRTPAQKLDPDVARALVENELAPAMLAVVDRAHGGVSSAGFYASVADCHTLVVVPAAVEALSGMQLERLNESLTALRRRMERALRQRRRSAAPPAEGSDRTADASAPAA